MSSLVRSMRRQRYRRYYYQQTAAFVFCFTILCNFHAMSNTIKAGLRL